MINVDIKKSVKANGEYSIFLTFPYDTRIITVIRTFPSRYWHPETKEWELPLNKLTELTNSLTDFEFKITGNYDELEHKQAIIPVDFDFKTKPFEHQIDGFNFGLQHNKWLLGDEQGLGKTKQVIDIAVAKKLQNDYKHCLIICGVNGLKWNWQNEVRTHSNEEAHILGQRTKKNGKISIGNSSQKLEDLKNIKELPYFLVTNIESLRNEDICAELKKLCNSKEIGLVAVDEIHKCKNPTSQQGKALLKVNAECKIAMTGTPLMNNPLDLYVILKWLDYEKHSFYAFKNHYCVMGGYGGYEIVSYKNLTELQKQLNEIMLRRLKRDVLDLPEKVYIDEYVEMSAKQAQIYKEVTAEIKSNIDIISTAANPLAELIRMRQATGYTGILSSVVQESAKLDRLVELVEESVENGNKVVIFSNWTQMTNAIYDRLFKHQFGIMRITGETPDNVRQSIVNSFQETDMCNVLIGTIGAMGTGLTLTAGTVEIFFDEPWNRANKEQAEDRCHRIGQKNNVTIYTMMCKDTIDERIHELIIKKGAMSDAIVDGMITGSKLETLEFLLS